MAYPNSGAVYQIEQVFKPPAGNTSPAESKKTYDLNMWFTTIIKLTMITTAIFGFLSYLWVLIQLDTLGPWNLAISFSIIQGVLWLALLIMAAYGRKELEEKRLEAVVQFMLYFTVYFVVVNFWQWFFFELNYVNANHGTPPSVLSSSFNGYMSFCVIQVFFAFFFQIYALQVLNSDNKPGDGLFDISGLNADNYGKIAIAFKVFSVLTLTIGLFSAFVFFFHLQGSVFSNLWMQMGLFIAFAACYLVQLGLYFALARNRDVIPGATVTNALEKTAVETLPMFKAHWTELDAIELFLFLSFFLQFGAWVNFWAGPARNYDGSYKFGSGDPYYASYTGLSIFQSILLPWYAYYLISAICFSQYVVGAASMEKSYAANLGQQSILTWLFTSKSGVVSQLSIKKNDGSNETYNDKVTWGTRVAMIIVFVLCFIWHFLFGIFVLTTLINKTFMANDWKTWSIIFIVISGFFWIVYFIKSIVFVTNLRQVNPGYNMLVFCTLARPLFAYTVAIFEVSYGMFDLLYNNGQNGEISSSDINDPALFVSVKYWSLLAIMLGVTILMLLVTKEMISSFLPGSKTFVVSDKDGKASVQLITLKNDGNVLTSSAEQS